MDEVRHQPPGVKSAIDRKDAEEQKALFVSLTNHPGWVKLAGMIKELADSQTELVIATPLHVTPEMTVFRQEYVKGQINGFLQMMTWPDVIIDACDNVLNSLPPATENSDDDPDDDTYGADPYPVRSSPDSDS